MHFIKPIWVILFLVALLFGTGCGSDAARTETGALPSNTVSVPKFERDSAYQFIAQQVAFGPRVPNSEAHRQCKEWLVDQLESYGAQVVEQDFKATAYNGDLLNGTNIIAQYNPENKKRVLLAAHWDSRYIADSPLSQVRQDEPILGADDGGSGVGVLLEVARQLHINPIEMGIDIVLFDAEDYGENGTNNIESWCLGSQHWSRNPHKNGYRAKYGILLDMVGSKGARFAVEQYSLQFAPQLVNKVWTLAERMGYGNYFVKVEGGGVTDDHYFVNTILGVPMINIINRPIGTITGFGEYWHTHHDNMEIIDPRTLRAVGQVILAVVYREANGNF